MVRCIYLIIVLQEQILLSDNNMVGDAGSLSASRDQDIIISSADPFANLTIGNYSISEASSSIGSGKVFIQFDNQTITAPSQDYYGSPRPFPIGSNPDMGAIENIRSKNLLRFISPKEVTQIVEARKVLS